MKEAPWLRKLKENDSIQKNEINFNKKGENHWLLLLLPDKMNQNILL